MYFIGRGPAVHSKGNAVLVSREKFLLRVLAADDGETGIAPSGKKDSFPYSDNSIWKKIPTRHLSSKKVLRLRLSCVEEPWQGAFSV